MPDDRLDDHKQRERPKQHGPGRIDGDSQSQRKCGSDCRADVGYETQHRCQDAPQNRAGNANQPQARPDNDSEASVQKELNQEKPAKTARSVVKCRCSTLQVMRARQPDQSITKILALKQNEDDKNDDDARCGEGMEQWGNEALQTFQRAWIRLTD